MAETNTEFIPRPYQIDLYEKALESNKIIYLPTGAGKTYIALLLLKHLSADIQKPFNMGGKRSVFIVNTVALVTQHTEYIIRHTGLSCQGYSGEMNVDSWSQEIWLEEFKQNEVLVMTCQIFLNIICHGYLQLSRVNLIIFDECHKGVSNHPMRQIMQNFEQYPTHEQPRVLALSATLLNANVKLCNIIDSIKSLETTFHASIATLNDAKGYSTNPQEVLIYYETYTKPIIWEVINKNLDYLLEFLKCVLIKDDFYNNESSIQFKPKSLNSKLKSNIDDVKEHIDTTGIYGINKSLLLHLVQLECKKKYTTNQHVIYIMEYIITEFIKLRKIIHDEMDGLTNQQQIFQFSSDHVLKLLTFLKDFNDNKLPDQKFCCIIFVKRRFTVKVVYHILKDVHEHDERYKFLCPDYIVGCSNNPFKNINETLCLSKWQKEALHRFRNGLSNCIVATDVLEEGIDICNCTLVVRFDVPGDFRSYVQSKGRARYATSQFVLMLNKNDSEYLKKYKLFQDTDVSLQKIFAESSREQPTDEEIKNDLYQCDLSPFVVTKSDGTKSILTEFTAIGIINKYCSLLLKSKFTALAPTWTLNKINEFETTYQVSLKLPIVSPLRETIIGDTMHSIDKAKRSAAFKTCIKLYKIGELTTDLIPCTNVISQDTDYLFPNWLEEEKGTKTGTNRRKRYHKLKYPEPLYGAFPIEGKTLYFHIISTKPIYSVPQDNRNLVFYNLLCDQSGYGILSTKIIPKITSFPIFMNVGELIVNVKVNHEKMVLTDDKIMKLRMFHTMIFSKIVSAIKPFMTFDVDNLDNSFLIVPTNEENKINWDVVNKYGRVKCVTCPVLPLKSNDYELALVIPNYRVSPNVYVVTQVCDDITPISCFPTEDFISYTHYYEQKHELKIRNLNQPMFEVKPISTKINCIIPRSMASGLSKRKRVSSFEDYDEHLVPELCKKIEFPALYWLKATTLPSILHRISQLLIAFDLRETIINEANLGQSTDDLPNYNWSAVMIAEESDQETEPMMDEQVTFDNGMLTAKLPDLSGPEIDVLNTDANLYPWSKEQEPPDLDRNADRIQLIDIEYYHHFMTDESKTITCPTKHKCKTITYESRPEVEIPSLEILKANDLIGPHPVQIMQALITKGNDVFNLERLETLGDSYLKFIISLFLYNTFPNYNEGRLTALKGKIIGNRNLYYCGTNRSIPGYMKVDAFIPLSTFIPPAYTTFRPLQTILLDAQVSPNVLYELSIPQEEIISGYISEQTRNLMEEKTLSWTAEESQTGMEHFIGVQTVPDKAVADCVEALIGVYLRSMGLEGATKLLIWFGILPKATNIKQLLYSNPHDPKTGSGNPDTLMPWAEVLENRLNYRFQNRAYLLQAFSHPSFTTNIITDCYQRLEFIGDAIIDFLITGYIYENCGELTPGELTDLRSALVNNITFACLSVKYGLHTALLSYSPTLNNIIDRFVKFQEERNYVVDDEVLYILLEEEECNMAEYVDVPKALADIFESLIGAIYLDTDKNITKVWEILFSLMHKEIDAFSKNVPKQPVRLIYEMLGNNCKFLSATLIEGTSTIMVPLEVINKRKSKLFHGFGSNKKEAKCAAAKLALKYLRCKTE